MEEEEEEATKKTDLGEEYRHHGTLPRKQYCLLSDLYRLDKGKESQASALRGPEVKVGERPQSQRITCRVGWRGSGFENCWKTEGCTVVRCQ